MHIRCILLIFTEDFASVFIKILASYFLFGVLIWFWYQGNVSFVECFWQVPSSSVFFFFPLKNLGKIVLKYWNVFVEFAIKTTWSWAFAYWENFDYCFNFLTSNLSIQIYFLIIQSWKIMFLGVYLFIPICPIFWQIVVCNSLLWSFVFLWCHCYFFSFTSDFIYLSLFFISLAEILLILSFQRAIFLFYWSFLFFSLCLFMLGSLLFLLLIFGFMCYAFSSSFGWKVSFLI